jgi:hypothetical protein
MMEESRQAQPAASSSLLDSGALGAEEDGVLGCPASGACRVCMEEACVERLACKCSGFAHTTCMQQWITARLQRGESLQEALRCEICRSLLRAPSISSHTPHPAASLSFSTDQDEEQYAGDADEGRVCSCSLRFRILATGTALLGCFVTGCVYAMFVIIPDAWDGMAGVLILALFLALFIVIRLLLDPRSCISCIHSYLWCQDFRVLAYPGGI